MASKRGIVLGLVALLAVVRSVLLPAQASSPLDLQATNCASFKSIALRDALGQLGGLRKWRLCPLRTGRGPEGWEGACRGP